MISAILSVAGSLSSQFPLAFFSQSLVFINSTAKQGSRYSGSAGVTHSDERALDPHTHPVFAVAGGDVRLPHVQDAA